MIIQYEGTIDFRLVRPMGRVFLGSKKEMALLFYNSVHRNNLKIPAVE